MREREGGREGDRICQKNACLCWRAFFARTYYTWTCHTPRMPPVATESAMSEARQPTASGPAKPQPNTTCTGASRTRYRVQGTGSSKMLRGCVATCAAPHATRVVVCEHGHAWSQGRVKPARSHPGGNVCPPCTPRAKAPGGIKGGLLGSHSPPYCDAQGWASHGTPRLWPHGSVNHAGWGQAWSSAARTHGGTCRQVVRTREGGGG